MIKLKITRTDGVTIEVEAELSEITQLLPGILPFPPVHVPSFTVENDMCPYGGVHEYPFPWHSIMPAACTKCGKAMGSSITFTRDSTIKIG